MALTASAARPTPRLFWRIGVTAEILALYVRVRRNLHDRDVRSVARELRGPDREVPLTSDDLTTALRLGRAVTRVLAFTPRRSRCLVQSLVLTRMLARRSIGSALVIGVSGGPFAAHAWVEVAGRPLLPDLRTQYVPLVRI